MPPKTVAGPERVGFEIHHKFYPLVTVADWRNGDFIMARDLTHLGPNDLFGGKADYLSVQMALAAVAVNRKRDDITEDQAVEFVRALKPGDILEVGFTNPVENEDDEDGDGGPPAEGDTSRLDSGSAESSGPSTDATPETAPGTASGTAD